MIIDSSVIENAQVGVKSSEKDAMGRDDFLKLLIAQLKHQDPTEPMDNTEFVSQMAQFSSLEQLFNLNEGLSSLNEISAQATSTAGLNIIGKEVEAAGNGVYVTNGRAANISFDLAETASRVKIHITDEAGNIVRTIDKGTMSAGSQSVVWDGTNGHGSMLQDGVYSYVIDAVTQSGKLVEATTFTRGIVDAISIDNGMTYLHIGNTSVLMSEVTEIRQPAGTNIQ